MMKGIAWVCILLVSLVLVQCTKVHINIDEEEQLKAITGPMAFSNLTLDLGGVWQVQNANGSVKLQGTVPGQIQTDLLAAKIIADPYLGYNDYNLMWVLWDNWTYSKTFTLNSTFASQKTILLICEGIDTISSISVNGKLVGTTENMFRRYEFNIAGAVQSGQNTITVAFTSAATYAANRVSAYPYEFPLSINIGQGNLTGRNLIRKEQCSFAWDWGPCFAPQGIWKDIGIVAFSDAFLDEIVPQILPVLFPKTWNVLVDAYVIASVAQTATVSATISTLNAQGSSGVVQLVAGENRVAVNVNVTNPNLWYPNGYGSQPLYFITVSLSVGGSVISSYTKRIGFRSFEIVEDPLPNGLSFYFEVNGIPIFAKGANWIPADSFESRSTDAVIENLLQSAVQANMNILRNWGGGIYQHDRFYDLADELGLMVWQEFMFACGTYPRDVPFLENVAQEVTHNVRHLSHHPALILWSGNNENEAALNPPGAGWYDTSNANPYLYVADYAELYLNTIYPAFKGADASRPFIASSPSNGLLSTDPNVGIVNRWGNPYSNFYGDTHYYNYDVDCTNVTFFPTPRFASEFGFQSHPSMYTWLQAANESDLAWNSSIVFHRQHHPDGNQQLLDQLLRFFKEPNMESSGFSDFVYLTQVVQAMCMKAEAEHYRRYRSDPLVNTMGTIYWQLNDIWQAPTWAGMEYGGRWKLLHYFAKNFYAPVLVSSYEDPVDSFHAYICNDLQQAIKGTFYITVFDYTGKSLANFGETGYVVPSMSSMSVFNASINSLVSASKCTSRATCFIKLSFVDTGNVVISTNVFFLSPLSNVALATPTITFSNFAQVSNTTVSFTVNSNTVAPYTFLQTPISGAFSDNGMVLLPGVSTNVTFTGWESFTVSSFQRSLTAKSIAQTYQ